MGWFGSVCSFVGGAISGALGAIGGALGGALSGLAAVIPGLNVLMATLTVVDILIAIAKALGIIEEEQDKEELGDRVIQGEKQGITREQFDSHEEYMKKLKEIDLDKELSNKLSKKDKLLAAGSVAIMGIQEKTGVEFGSEMKFMTEIVRKPEFFTKARVHSLINEFARVDGTMDQISEYFDNKGTLSIADAKKIEDAMMKAEKALDSKVDENSVFNNWDEMKRN